MTVSRDGITLRVRRRPPSRLAAEIARARDELLTRAARAKALDLTDRPIAAAAMRGKAVAYREAVDLLIAALARADA